MELLAIGIGHPDRGDDAVGRIVAARLRECAPGGVTVLEHDGEATALLAWLGRAEAAILVDAAMSGEAVGTVRRFDVGRAPLPNGCFGLSTHGMGLAEAVELARALGQLPARCIVYAVEARSFDHGAPPSPKVAAAVDEVVRSVLAELEAAEGHCTATRTVPPPLAGEGGRRSRPGGGHAQKGTPPDSLRSPPSSCRGGMKRRAMPREKATPRRGR
jgi:hydrogenase maturation protease